VTPPRLVLVLSENWTLTSPRDLRALVRLGVEAEDAGIDTVMLSEHVVLGPSSGVNGVMGNPRDYAAPGNQDPATPWPDSIVLAAAIAAQTTTLRVALAAIIAPLRHPLLLAKQLATLDLLAEGRLVVQPTVSWHRDEYDALGVPFERRGAILDEQLAAMRAAWTTSPSSFEGSFFRFADVHVEPKAFRPDGPRLWFGGQRLHGPITRRLAAYGHGFHPFGTPTPAELVALRRAMAEHGRDIAELELIGGIRGTFAAEDDVADLARACETIPQQLEQGYTSICFKPSMFTDDIGAVGGLCRELVARVATLSS
jgi:alkanesulfonate monooxygenase SsuD/methylene tetrahydromethanopterin reductase-like flavin-dependent oxidoreductase (luciferase family)